LKSVQSSALNACAPKQNTLARRIEAAVVPVT
jgi:hypothetical protein